jgi:hypothetical protein
MLKSDQRSIREEARQHGYRERHIYALEKIPILLSARRPAGKSDVIRCPR